MKRNFFYFFTIAFLICGYVNPNCTEVSKQNEILEKEKVLKIAGEIALKTYGNALKDELPLKAKLVGDSVWIIEGSLPKGSDGGTVYIELRRADNKLIKITHYK